jgi:hypothetical protein
MAVAEEQISPIPTIHLHCNRTAMRCDAFESEDIKKNSNQNQPLYVARNIATKKKEVIKLLGYTTTNNV